MDQRISFDRHHRRRQTGGRGVTGAFDDLGGQEQANDVLGLFAGGGR